ncbi:MAG TPA: beta-galactosidase, partial [Planctomycetota bacterium]|nr:beta-galactosidase [Planctomycetota bacterium]
PAVWRADGEGPARTYRHWEALYSLLGRSAAWAGGRELTREGEAVALETKHPDGNVTPFVWRDKEGKVTDWELRFVAPGADGIARVEIQSNDVKRGDPIGIAFNPPEVQGQIAWEVLLGERARGRWRTIETFEQDAAKTRMIVMKAPSDRLTQILGIIRVTGSVNGKVVARGEAEVVVTPRGETWDEYEIFQWPVDGLSYLREWEDVKMIEAGASGVMDTQWNNRERLLRWARAGLRILPHNLDVRPLHIRPAEFTKIAANYNQTKDKKFLVRPTSFADPAFLEGARKRVAAGATLLKPFHIPAYVLADEPSLTSYRESFDFDFHPENIKLFRAALEKKFGAVGELNAALGTKFEAFDKIEPPTTDEAKAAGNYGLWNEWRAHNDTVMAEGYRHYRDAIREVDPKARISVSGTQVANPYDGFDWVKLSPYFDAMNGYGYGEQERTRLSFYPGVMKNATPAGYGNKGQGVQYQLWEQLTNHGCGHVLFWWVSFRNPDLTFCKSADDYARGFAEMRSGIGRQYQLAHRWTSPVAVLYSMNAMRAAWVQGKFDAWTKELEGFTREIVAEGFDPVFVSEEQVAAGELEKRGIKALFLPLPISLGHGVKKGGVGTLAGLQKFAAAGGVIVAKSAPQQDEFLQAATVPEDAWAKLLEKSKDKKTGEALAAAGLKPWVTVKKPDGGNVPGLSVTVHTLGENKGYLLTMLRRPIGQKQVVGADGVITYQPDTSGGNQLEEAVIDVTDLGPSETYSLREIPDNLIPFRQAIGVGKLLLKLPAGDAISIAILPYKVEKLNLAAKLQERNVIVEWKIAADKGPLARHAVRVEVSENGKPDPVLSTNATTNEDGSGRVVIPLAVEDKGRKLTISLRDVLSGVEEKSEVVVP